MADSEPLDFEDVAIVHLAKRARKIHVSVGLASVLVGILAGQVAAWLFLDAVQVVPAVVYGAVFLGPLLACVFIGRDLAKKLIRRRAPAWSEEMAEQYQLEAAQLRGYIDHM